MKKVIAVSVFLSLFMVMFIMSLMTFPNFLGGRSDGYSGSSAAERQPSESFGWEALKRWTTGSDGRTLFQKKGSPVTELALNIAADLESDYDKMVAVYDWVTANAAYDLDKAENIAAYGAGAEYLLETGRGVCHDYAELTRALLAAVGVEATYEKGEVSLGDGRSELHAWNHVLIGDTWYGLDTTWGSGIIFEDKALFVQKPRRIYMTSLEELERLHSDPEYKQQRELEYLRETSLNEPVAYLSRAEQDLFNSLNSYRSSLGLPLLSEEMRLKDMAHRHAANFAETVCAGNEFSLKELSDELTGRVGGLNIKSASMNAFSKWLYYPGISADFLEMVSSYHAEPLAEEQWKAVTVGVIRKGDLVVTIFIFIEYY